MKTFVRCVVGATHPAANAKVGRLLVKTLISGLLSFVGLSAMLASFVEAFANYYDGAYWSLLWGVVFLQTSRLLTQRAPDRVVRAAKIVGFTNNE